MLFQPLITAVAPVLPSFSVLGYLDPGTGSYALQLLLAGLFGGMFALKQSWQQIRARYAQGAPWLKRPSAQLEGSD